MTLEEFVSNINTARSARQTAIEKLEAAMSELAAADAQMDHVLAFIPEGTSEDAYDKIDRIESARNSIYNIFTPVKSFADFFGFGDLL